MQLIKVFYRPEMVAQSQSRSPSSAKPEAVVQDWIDEGLPIKVENFEPVAKSDLETVHTGFFVEGIFSGQLDNGHGNNCQTLANSFLYTVGSMVAAAESGDDVSCSPTSGFHHAGPSVAMGFCTFNGLMIAALKLMRAPKRREVAILDLDYHYGNGTDMIIAAMKLRTFHVTMGSRSWASGEQFLEHLKRAVSVIPADVVLYQAGADAHEDDPYGGLLSTAEMRERDDIVFEGLKKRGIKVAWNLAGGYQVDDDGGIGKVIELHRNTMLACCETWGLR